MVQVVLKAQWKFLALVRLIVFGLTRIGGWPILIFCVDFAAYILGTKEPAQLCNVMHVWISIMVYIFLIPLHPTFHPL